MHAKQAGSNQASEEPLTSLTHWKRLAPMGSGKSWQDLQWPFSTPLAAEAHLRDAQQLCPRCPASECVSEGTAAQANAGLREAQAPAQGSRRGNFSRECISTGAHQACLLRSPLAVACLGEEALVVIPP